jgi:hypothetical protein
MSTSIEDAGATTTDGVVLTAPLYPVATRIEMEWWPPRQWTFSICGARDSPLESRGEAGSIRLRFTRATVTPAAEVLYAGPGISPAEEAVNGPNYTMMCFVIMPFGKKPVGKRKLFGLFPWGDRLVDFDAIYRDIFQPAIEQTPLPEGGHLVPLRTDMNPAAADIDVQMFRGIVFARMVLSDITGLNPNVFYELGVRHHSNETGTAIFRQTDTPIPFDIGHIKAIPYEYYPAENIARARETVKLILAESLKQNLVTSPIQRAILNQRPPKTP